MPPQSKHHRFSYFAKLGGALTLAILADLFFFDAIPGATLGIFAAAWLIFVALLRPAVRRNRAAQVGLVLAAIYSFALFDDPSLLGIALFWTALSMAALLPRAYFHQALTWGAPLLLHAFGGPFTPGSDVRRLARTSRRPGRFDLRNLARTLLLPVVGGLAFFILFTIANPLIARAIDTMSSPDIVRIFFWLIIALIVWPAFRPLALVTRAIGRREQGSALLPEVPLASVVMALFVFNAIFAIQNALDIAFLWSGAPLPGAITLADYAHRGTYTLIATTLIAGGLALWMLAPGSESSHNPLARRLLALWVVQNLLLVASSMLRTLDYVDAFSLTRLRIAALAWMLLVAIGLILIGWRILRGRSAAWLINANALTALVVLTASAFVDLGAVAAQWNVRHAREVGGAGPHIDLCYLDRLGPSALLAIVELEGRVRDPSLKDRLAWLREDKMRHLAVQQANWRGWTWRDARRLAAARTLVGQNPQQPIATQGWRDCGGFIVLPPPPPAPAPASTPAAPPPTAANPVPTPAAKINMRETLTNGTEP